MWEVHGYPGISRGLDAHRIKLVLVTPMEYHKGEKWYSIGVFLLIKLIWKLK